MLFKKQKASCSQNRCETRDASHMQNTVDFDESRVLFNNTVNL